MSEELALQTGRNVSARRQLQRVWSKQAVALRTAGLIVLAVVLVIVVLFALDNIGAWLSNLHH